MWSDSVEVLVDVLRDRLDLSVQIVLNIEHVILVVFANEVDCKAEMAEPTRTADSVQVSVGLAWEIKVDNNVDGDNVNTTGKNIWGDQTASLTTLEIMENSAVKEESELEDLNLIREVACFTYRFLSRWSILEWMKKQE